MAPLLLLATCSLISHSLSPIRNFDLPVPNSPHFFTARWLNGSTALRSQTTSPPSQIPTPNTWYGPQEVTFNIQYAGNPYDPAENDVKVRFTSDNGVSLERLAYFSHGAWRSTLVAPQPGRYKAILVHNGHDSTEESVPPVLILNQKLDHGFVHRDPANANRFVYDDGTEIFPIGFDLGWQDPGLIPMADQLAKMGSAKLTWTRVWSDNWDDKNPWWPEGDPYAIKGQLWPKALDTWGTVAKACDSNGINYQFVLFNHGSFSSTTDPNWPQHPWNAANGGFLKDAADFFTDPEAKRRTKMWLRYAVARWGPDPHLFAWELFNEVQWTDAAKNGLWPQIARWHKEMAGYVRSLDPYGHLVTTSSQMDEPGLWEAMDYYQPHDYGDDLPSEFAHLLGPKDKPLFVGEFGPNHDLGAREKSFIGSVIWESLRLNQSASAMYWYWDRVEKGDEYALFANWAKLIEVSDIADHPGGQPVFVTSTIGKASGLRDINWVLVRIQGASGKSPRISFRGIIEGTWRVQTINLDTGEDAQDLAVSRNGFMQLGKIKGDDVGIVLTMDR